MTVMQLKLTGPLKESVDIEDTATVGDLRNMVCERLSLPMEGVKLLCKGRVLKNDDKSLAEYRIKEGSKVIVMKACSLSLSLSHALSLFLSLYLFHLSPALPTLPTFLHAPLTPTRPFP